MLLSLFRTGAINSNNFEWNVLEKFETAYSHTMHKSKQAFALFVLKKIFLLFFIYFDNKISDTLSAKI